MLLNLIRLSWTFKADSIGYVNKLKMKCIKFYIFTVKYILYDIIITEYYLLFFLAMLPEYE